MKVLAVDVGGTHVKILVQGQTERRECASGPGLSAARMVEQVQALARGWAYDRVSVGFPGPVVHDRPAAEPHNLGRGWLGFDFAQAFGRPTRVVNDAAMQARRQRERVSRRLPPVAGIPARSATGRSRGSRRGARRSLRHGRNGREPER